MNQAQRIASYGIARPIRAIAVLAASGILAMQAMAQTTLYWTGEKSVNHWSNASTQTNWSTTDPFTNSVAFTTGSNVRFTQTAININESFVLVNGTVSAGSILATNATGAFTLTGGSVVATSLTVNGGGNFNLWNSSTSVGSGTVTVGNGSELTTSYQGIGGTLTAGLIHATGSFTQGSGVTQGNTNDSGTIILAGNDRIINAAITLGGGTLRTDGFDQGTSTTAGLGALTLTADSILDFTSTGGLLHFSGFAPGTSTLQIWNWDNSDQLYFSPQLNEAQLAQIVFYSDNGLTRLESPVIGGNGGIVPVPEPATIFGAAAVLGLVSWRERRRIGMMIQSLR